MQENKLKPELQLVEKPTTTFYKQLDLGYNLYVSFSAANAKGEKEPQIGRHIR